MHAKMLAPVEYEVNTFLGTKKKKKLDEVVLEVRLDTDRTLPYRFWWTTNSTSILKFLTFKG